ncbi:hypothetical protein PR048_007413 [Dryococelus australis]|uniref:Uncharacterized protein n=1 Tax=Dryococelus australis TaxID=614101 RepID=A0ABQ9HU79_9NEOP|nr:hypothetical protein PR048_007413 [Dryococelus australis]
MPDKTEEELWRLLQAAVAQRTWKIREFNDLQARPHSLVCNHADINCPLVACILSYVSHWPNVLQELSYVSHWPNVLQELSYVSHWPNVLQELSYVSHWPNVLQELSYVSHWPNVLQELSYISHWPNVLQELSYISHWPNVLQELSYISHWPNVLQELPNNAWTNGKGCLFLTHESHAIPFPAKCLKLVRNADGFGRFLPSSCFSGHDPPTPIQQIKKGKGEGGSLPQLGERDRERAEPAHLPPRRTKFNPWPSNCRIFAPVVILPDVAADQRVFSRFSRFCAPSFRRCSILTSIILIGSQGLAVTSRLKLFTLSIPRIHFVARTPGRTLRLPARGLISRHHASNVKVTVTAILMPRHRGYCLQNLYSQARGNRIHSVTRHTIPVLQMFTSSPPRDISSMHCHGGVVVRLLTSHQA